MSAPSQRVGRVSSHGAKAKDAANAGSRHPAHKARRPSPVGRVPSRSATTTGPKKSGSSPNAGSGDPAYKTHRPPPVGRVSPRGASPERAKEGWRTVALGEIVEINPRPGGDEFNDDLLASFIPMKCVEEESGRFQPFGDKKVAKVRKGYTPFRDGDVIFAKVTPCMENGKAAVLKGLTNGIGFGSTEFFVLRPKAGLDAHYLFHFILRSNFRREAARNMTGAVGLRRVPKAWFEQQTIPLPEPKEQRRIVAEIEKQFTRLEAGVAALQRVQANLKRYRAAVLKAACEGKLVPTEAELAAKNAKKNSDPGSASSVAKHPGYETGTELLTRILAERRKNWEQTPAGGSRPTTGRADAVGRVPSRGVRGRGKYKEPAAPDTANLPPLPEGWTWATMPQLGELNRGKSKHRPRDEARLYGGPYPFIQTGDIRKSRGTIREHHQTYSEFGLAQSRLWPAGTLCITIAANIAETGILTYPSCFPDSVVGFVQDGPLAITRYVEFFIRIAKEKLTQFAPATAQKNINLDVLQKVAIPLPPLAEQERIVAEVERRLSVVEELDSVVTANLQRASRLRQSILQKAFSGELV